MPADAIVGPEPRVQPATRMLDDERAGRILSQVLELAEQLPTRRRGKLAYPPFRRRIA